MFRKLNSIIFLLSRSKLRKGPDIDPKLKDYSSTYRLKKQINSQRLKFETSGSETFSEVINNPKPKLKQRFKVDTKKLNHDLKKMIKDKIKPQNLQPYSDDGSDLKFLEEGRSYLNDQKAEVEFQQKFRKQLFMKQQTSRMLKRQANKHHHFLPQNQNNPYNQYLRAKDKLKNKRIQSMMNYKRNNEQLQLLLDSGFMDDPNNLQIIINKINKQQPIQQIQQKVHSKGPEDSSQALAPSQGKSLVQKMEDNSVGPSEVRDFSKIEQFIDQYQASSEEDKIKAAEDVELLLKIREYQRNLFLSRYQQINFRFKGRVEFSNFKQFEILSYIKHEDIQPIKLLEMFDQNQEKLSRFNVPIITPAVMSRIYSKTSTYRFAQSDQNNHINLISHPLFVKLQKSLFRQLDKISDQLYCDTVWTYAKNHQQEEGILNIKMSNAIQKVIFTEMLERIARLREVDLGLLMRSIIKLNMLSNDEYKEKWGQVVQVLGQRLPLMTQPYEYQSVMQFIQLLPPTPKSIEIIVNNINFFNKFVWQDRGTLLTFTRVCSCLINSSKLIDKLEHNKTFLRLVEIINNKVEQTKPIITNLTINELSNILIVWSQLNKYPLLKQIPSVLINTAKKEIVDSLNMQKHKVYQYTLPTIINALSTYDYTHNLLKGSSKYIDSSDLLTPFETKNIMKIATLRHLLPGRTFVYNSKLYFPYHSLAKFVELQHQALSLRSIAESLYGLSLVQYKNQGIYDSLVYKVMQTLQKEQRQQKRDHLTFKQVTQLIKIITCYSLQKRSTDLIEQIYDKIIKEGKRHFRNIKPNILLNLFASYVNIFTMPTAAPSEQNISYDYLLQRWNRNKGSIFIFAALYRDIFKDLLDTLQHEQLITLYMINTQMLNNTSRIIQSTEDYSIQSSFGTIHQTIKGNTIQLLHKICQIPHQVLKINYKFAIALCFRLNQFDFPEDFKLQNNFHQFDKIEKEFYDRYIEDILTEQQNVGSSLTYKQTYDKLFLKLKKDSSIEPHQIKLGTWKIQVQAKKTIYFVATYEHLMSKHYESQASVGLFGLWRLYSQIYRRRGWKFQLVCTMLQ